MSNWIPVSERHPEKNQDVWYYFEVTGVSWGKYLGDDCFGCGMCFLCGDVTHWADAPAPQPPGSIVRGLTNKAEFTD